MDTIQVTLTESQNACATLFYGVFGENIGQAAYLKLADFTEMLTALSTPDASVLVSTTHKAVQANFRAARAMGLI